MIECEKKIDGLFSVYRYRESETYSMLCGLLPDPVISQMTYMLMFRR